MNDVARRTLFRYGIAIDLVILATGVGLLVPAPTAALLIGVYAGAVALSVWRGGWKGALVAMALSLSALATLFPEGMGARQFGWFVEAAIVGSALVAWMTRPRVVADDVPVEEIAEPEEPPAPLALVVPFEDPQAKGREREEQQRRQLEAERQRFEEERLAAEEALRRQLDEERGADGGAERETASPSPAPKPTFVQSLTSWFRGEDRPHALNLKTKRVATNGAAALPEVTPLRPVPLPAPASAKPRLLLIERRRATADTAVPKLAHRGVEAQIVERWVDAVDEIFRFKPHALFLDVEHPEFERMHRSVSETTRLPIILTGRAGSIPPAVKHAAFVSRPYDIEEVTRLAQRATANPEGLLGATTAN